MKTKYFTAEVPQLILKGKWLEEAGFDANIMTTIKVEKGRITILNL